MSETKNPLRKRGKGQHVRPGTDAKKARQERAKARAAEAEA